VAYSTRDKKKDQAVLMIFSPPHIPPHETGAFFTIQKPGREGKRDWRKFQGERIKKGVKEG
jgi:hypothetical protein